MIEDLRFLQEQGQAALRSVLSRHVGKEVLITYHDGNGEPFTGFHGSLYKHSPSRWLVSWRHGYAYFNEDMVQDLSIETDNKLHISVALHSEVIE